MGCLDCTLCDKAILCSACVTDGKTACKKCQKKNGDSPYTKASVNIVAQNILSAAKFRCPFACPLQQIPFDELEKHIKSDCEYRLQHCPLKCDVKLTPAQVQRHVANDCENAQVTCPQCGLDKVLGRKIYRGKLQHHLQDECKDLTVCETCHGSYRSGVKLEGKDYDHNCVTYLHSLIREIAGEESYNKAVENLLPKAECTESMGTLNKKVAL